MKTRRLHLIRTVFVSACALLSTVGLGCGEVEIRSYTAPQPQKVVAKPHTDSRPAQVSPFSDTVRQPPIDYRTPDGWQPDSDPSGMSVAAFAIAAGDQRARMTVTPLAGAAGGLVGNINRWRGQIGLEPVEPSQLGEIIRKIDVAGVEAQYVDLVGPDGPNGSQRILGVVAITGGTSWFFKLTGPANLVGGQKDAFESFVRSVRFDGKEKGNE